MKTVAKVRYDNRMAPDDHFLEDADPGECESSSLKIAAWFSVALGALALGVYLGRELRSRYKFKHRTPYDYYSHAGDDENGFAEFGFGV
jgi:hypothetical protein